MVSGLLQRCTSGSGPGFCPALMGLGPAREAAEALFDEALASLGDLGPRAEPLRQLAAYMVQRDR